MKGKKILVGHWTIKLGTQMIGCNKSFQGFFFSTHTTALWPTEQSSILSVKFDCPGAHDFGTGSYLYYNMVKLSVVHYLLLTSSIVCSYYFLKQMIPRLFTSAIIHPVVKWRVR